MDPLDLDKAAKAAKFWGPFNYLWRLKRANAVAPEAAAPGIAWGAVIATGVVVGVVVVGGIYLWMQPWKSQSPPVKPGIALQNHAAEREGAGTAIRTPREPARAAAPATPQHGVGVWRVGTPIVNGTAKDVSGEASANASLHFSPKDFDANYWLSGVPDTLEPGEAFTVTLHGNLTPAQGVVGAGALAEVIAEGFGGEGAKSAMLTLPGDTKTVVVQGVAPAAARKVGAAGPDFVLRAWNFDRWVVVPYRWEEVR
jgi:hypothetical protein